jgi:hypothetical protein
MDLPHDDRADQEDTEWLGLTAAPVYVRLLLHRLRALAHVGAAPQDGCLRCGGELVPLMTLQRCERCAEPWPLPSHGAVARDAGERPQHGHQVAVAQE